MTTTATREIEIVVKNMTSDEVAKVLESIDFEVYEKEDDENGAYVHAEIEFDADIETVVILGYGGSDTETYVTLYDETTKESIMDALGTTEVDFESFETDADIEEKLFF